RSQIVILDALLKLRQVCCDLRLVKGVESKGNQADKGKLGALLQLLDELLEAEALSAEPDWPAFRARVRERLQAASAHVEMQTDILRQEH
ncbi:hypothetical protein KC220_23475, partial [Mycobacterium tuberculosis]|nr:hypothetical protein [Mycobacterium tuberculosis]